ADRGDLRSVRPAPLRAARRTRPRRPDRSAVRAVQPHTAASGALHARNARLPVRRGCCRGHRSDRRRAVGWRLAPRSSLDGRRAGTVEITNGGGTRAVSLSAYLDGQAEERAQSRAREWIKGLRAIPVDGQPMRARFTAGGDDSLWWFTEIYLHKEQGVLTVMRTIAAVD